MEDNQKLQKYLKNIGELQEQDTKSTFYSDFSFIKNTRPLKYQRLFGFWKFVIIDALNKGLIKETQIPWTIKPTELAHKFVLGNSYPLGLDAILIQLEKDGELVLYNEYKNKNITLFSFSYLYYFIFQYLLNYYRFDPTKLYLSKSAVKNILSIIFNYYSDNFLYPIVDSLLTYSEFIRDICVPAFSNDGMPNIDWERISVEDKQVLLNCLEEKGVIIYLDSSKEIMLKFPEPQYVLQYLNDDSPIPNSEFTESEKGIISIKKTKKNLELQISEIEAKIEQTVGNVKRYLIKDQKSLAIHFLKQKKNLLAILEKRIISLSSLEDILLNIKSAQSSVEIVQAFKAGSKSLQSILKSKNITLETIEDTMDELTDTLADYKEIDDAVSNTISDSPGDEELENELNDLISSQLRSLQSSPKKKMAENTGIDTPIRSSIDKFDRLEIVSTSSEDSIHDKIPALES